MRVKLNLIKHGIKIRNNNPRQYIEEFRAAKAECPMDGQTLLGLPKSKKIPNFLPAKITVTVTFVN